MKPQLDELPELLGDPETAIASISSSRSIPDAKISAAVVPCRLWIIAMAGPFNCAQRPRPQFSGAKPSGIDLDQFSSRVNRSPWSPPPPCWSSSSSPASSVRPISTEILLNSVGSHLSQLFDSRGPPHMKAGLPTISGA